MYYPFPMNPENPKLKAAVLEILASPEAAEIIRSSAEASRLIVYMNRRDGARLLAEFFTNTLKHIESRL